MTDKDRPQQAEAQEPATPATANPFAKQFATIARQLLDFTTTGIFYSNEEYEQEARRIFDKSRDALIDRLLEKINSDQMPDRDAEAFVKEQTRFSFQAALEQALTPLKTLWSSAYMKAIMCALSLPVSFAIPSVPLVIQDNAVTYFFAKHPEIDPKGDTSITDEQSKEIKSILAKMDSFFCSNLSKEEIEQTPAEELQDKVGDLLILFITQENPTPETAERITENLPRLSYHPSTKITTVTDKLMNVFFSVNAPKEAGVLNGQQRMAIPVDDLIPVKYEGHNSGTEITLYYDYFYDEETLSRFGISKGFEGYESFVATIIDNLYDNGDRVVSYSKFLEEMGATGRPSAEDITKLANALIKGATTNFYMNDKEVQQKLGKNDSYTEIIGQKVFPIIIKNTRNGKTGFATDGAIIIEGHTPFYKVGASLNRITRWKKEILQLYKGRRTDRYWNVLQFLFREIGWMRNAKSKRSNKILYSSVYAQNGDTTTRAKQLTRTMLFRLLDECFIPAGYVTAYKEDNGGSGPGVKITLNKTPLLLE